MAEQHMLAWMFGLGTGELMVIALVILIAVGPDRMPTMVKALGKGVREFRRASDELRKQSGIDEMLREDHLGLRQLQETVRKEVMQPMHQAIEAEIVKPATVLLAPESVVEGGLVARETVTPDDVQQAEPAPTSLPPEPEPSPNDVVAAVVVPNEEKPS